MSIKLRDWQKNFIEGLYDENTFKTQCEAGWYDWFCKTKSLANKTKRLGQIVKQVKDNGKINLDTMYVWFKNNCPVVGPLYDDFRFADLETGTTLMTITVADSYEDSRYCVYGRKFSNKDNIFESTALFKTNSSRELVKWLNMPW